MQRLNKENWDACPGALDWIEDNNIKSLEEAWEKCQRGDWMLWLYTRLHPENIRERVLAAGHCANTVRHLMTDKRSIAAVDAAIAFGEGKITEKELEKTCKAAFVAASAAYTYASAAAAYAADTATYVAAYDNKKENQLKKANICREYLHPLF